MKVDKSLLKPGEKLRCDEINEPLKVGERVRAVFFHDTNPGNRGDYDSLLRKIGDGFVFESRSVSGIVFCYAEMDGDNRFSTVAIFRDGRPDWTYELLPLRLLMSDTALALDNLRERMDRDRAHNLTVMGIGV